MVFSSLFDAVAAEEAEKTASSSARGGAPAVAQTDVDAENADDAELEIEELPEAPLLVNGSATPEIDLGRVFKLTQRFFSFVLENPSDKDVEYKAIVINCDCTRPMGDVKEKGVIPAHGKMKVSMRLNCLDLNVEKRFYRYIRFVLEGYQPFQVNFTGELSRDLYMAYLEDPEQKAYTEVNFGYNNDLNAKKVVKLNITSTLPEDEPLELGKVRCTGPFVAALHQFDDHHWGVEVHAVPPMKPGVVQQYVVVEVVKPAAPDGGRHAIALRISGVYGTQLKPSAEDVFYDEQVDKGEKVVKYVEVTRQVIMDPNMFRAIIKNLPQPYEISLTKLTADELQVKAPAAVQVTKHESSSGVIIECTMEKALLTEKGCEVELTAENAAPAFIRFALLGDAERAQLAEEAAREAAEAAAEAEAEAEDERARAGRKTVTDRLNEKAEAEKAEARAEKER